MDISVNEPIQLKKSPLESGKVKLAKGLLFISGLIFMVFGGSLMAIGLYAQLDHGFVSEIIGSALYQAAGYTAIFSGFVILWLGILGAVAGHRQARGQLIVYLVLTLLLALIALMSAILATVFRASLIQTAKATMRNSLRMHYGKTRLITEAWDLTQSSLRCCAVEPNGWAEYIGSEWDILTNADARDLRKKLPEWSPLYKFVPNSCCLRLLDPRTMWPSGRYKDLGQCTYWPYGPPNHLTGAFNDALYYRGCYEAGALYLSSHGRFFAGLGFILFVAMVAGACGALTVLSNLDPLAVKVRTDARAAYLKADPLLMTSDYAKGGY